MSIRILTSTAFLLALLGLAQPSLAEAAPSPSAAPATAPDEEPAAQPGEAVEADGAVEEIEALQARFLSVMKQAEEIGYEGRYERLREIVTESFDLPFMAEKSIGRHWKQLTPDEQQRWLGTFQDMTAATYAGRFEGFSGQRFEIAGQEDAAHGTVVVLARVVSPGEEDTQINYRMREQDGEWRVIDVYLNGTVSELALRRSEYSSVLKREGFEKLIETVDAKTEQLAQEAVN